MNPTSELRQVGKKWGPDFLYCSHAQSSREDTGFPHSTRLKLKAHSITSPNRLQVKISNASLPQALSGCEHCPLLPLPQILRHKTPSECSWNIQFRQEPTLLTESPRPTPIGCRPGQPRTQWARGVGVGGTSGYLKAAPAQAHSVRPGRRR